MLCRNTVSSSDSCSRRASQVTSGRSLLCVLGPELRVDPPHGFAGNDILGSCLYCSGVCIATVRL
jgi:hypothetical protein